MTAERRFSAADALLDETTYAYDFDGIRTSRTTSAGTAVYAQHPILRDVVGPHGTLLRAGSDPRGAILAQSLGHVGRVLAGRILADDGSMHAFTDRFGADQHEYGERGFPAQHSVSAGAWYHCSMFEVGDVLGPLTIREVLEDDPLLPCFEAVDAQGRVHRVRALGLTSDLPAEPLARFADRVGRIAGLEHAAVLTPRHWSAEPPVYIAGAHVQGETLASILDRLGPLSWEASASIGREVAAALAAAAEVGATHGGLTAGAVLVHPDGVMLADWGIGELASRLSNDHSQLLPSVVDSLAPEHVHSQAITPATDVFVLGALLYRTLSGTHPFQAPSPLGITIKLAMVTFPPLAADLAPEALREAIQRAMAADPKERPSAEALVRAFEAVVPRSDVREDALRALVVATPSEAESAPPARSPPVLSPPVLSPPVLSPPVQATHPARPSTHDSGFGGGSPPATVGFQGPPPSASPETAEPTAVVLSPSADMPASAPKHSGFGGVGQRGAGFDDAATEFAPPPRMPEAEAELPVDSTLVVPPKRPAPLRAAPTPSRSPSPSWILWVAAAFGAFIVLGVITALAMLLST